MEKKTKITLFTIGAIAGGGYLLWEFVLKGMFQKPGAPDQMGIVPGTNVAGNVLPPDGGMLPPPNIPLPQPEPAPIFIEVKPSPLGTPDNKLKWNTLKMKQGMIGQEIKRAQELLNAISKKYGTAQIEADGEYGPITAGKMQTIVGTGPKTLKQVYEKYKAVVKK